MAMNYEELYELVMESKLGDMMVSMRKNSFKKQFNYDEDSKTITVNGRKYKVDLDTDNPNMTVTGYGGERITVLRQTMAELSTSDPVIYFDKEFFHVMGKKQREAIMQHEIGHIRMHNINRKNIHRDKGFVDKNTIRDMVHASLDGNNDFGDDEIKKTIKYLLSRPSVKLWLWTGDRKSVPPEVRKELREVMIKYSAGGHSNPTELEADRYAMNQVSEKALISALWQYNKKSEKFAKKTVKNLEKEYESEYKHASDEDKKNMVSPKDYKHNLSGELNKVVERNRDELKLRIDASKDDRLRNADIYKRDIRK